MEGARLGGPAHSRTALDAANVVATRVPDPTPAPESVPGHIALVLQAKNRGRRSMNPAEADHEREQRLQRVACVACRNIADRYAEGGENKAHELHARAADGVETEHPLGVCGCRQDYHGNEQQDQDRHRDVPR
jgi:hypothetical protein